MSEDPILDAAIEVAKERSEDIYNDALKPMMVETGGVLETFSGFFNNVMLYQIKKLNLTYKYKFQEFATDLEMKTNEIPDDKLTDLPLNLAGPTLESLKYTIDVKEIREMYLNLLLSSMNSDTTKLTHPAYVEIIKAMSSLDAIIFKNIVAINDNIACANITFRFDLKQYANAMPSIFAPQLLAGEEPFLISTSIENLCRLGLITYNETGSLTGYDYNSFKEHPFVIEQFEKYKKLNLNVNLNMMVNNGALTMNDFGINFAKVCFD